MVVSDGIDRAIYQRSVRATAPELAQYLEEILGQSLTALLLGINDARAVDQYAHGQAKPTRAVKAVLQHAFVVAKLLEELEPPDVIRAWFLGANPILDDQPPALVLRSDPSWVLEAAREFLANG